MLAVAAALLWVAHNAEPLLRARVVHALADRFHATVELDALHLTVVPVSGKVGFEVEGTGLRIRRIQNPASPSSDAPLLTIRSFQFRTGLRQALEPTMHIALVHIQGAELRIPPKQDRGPLLAARTPASGTERESIQLDRLVFDDLRILVETRRPGKLPLTFDIANLTLTHILPRQPLIYDATLRNPIPVGDVRSTGHFGPWIGESPRDTPLDGSYILSHADLSTIKGIGGILTSNGRFAGTLNQITVDGTSDTPDFHLSTSGHPLPLHTDFHAIVDGTSGDTTLEPVHALLARSPITAIGSITHHSGVPGKNIDLDITIGGPRGAARIDDLLTLAVRTDPPALHGALSAHARVEIPPGQGNVTHRMKLDGTFSIEQATFTNPRLQQQIEEVSERASGWPERANRDQAEVITSSMKGSFHLEDEQVTIPQMAFQMRGAAVNVEGQYGLNGATMDLHGKLRTQATASEMVGGWKQLLLMPFDKYLKKNGAGMEIPFKLSGTQKDPKLALDFDQFKKR